MTTEESRILVREVIEGWAKAIGAKDVEGAMAYFAHDVLSFDLAPPLQHMGREVIRKNMKE